MSLLYIFNCRFLSSDLFCFGKCWKTFRLEKIKWRHNCKGFSLPPPLSLIHAHIQHEHSLEINSYFEHFTTVTDIHGLMQLYSLRTFLCSDSDWNVFSEVTSRVRNPFHSNLLRSTYIITHTNKQMKIVTFLSTHFWWFNSH